MRGINGGVPVIYGELREMRGVAKEKRGKKDDHVWPVA